MLKLVFVSVTVAAAILSNQLSALPIAEGAAQCHAFVRLP